MGDFVGKAGSRLRLAGDSVMFAFSQLRADRFRTFLSLAGVCVGIFSIVAVLTLVDSLDDGIRRSFDEFGSDVVFVEQVPIEPDLNDEGVFRWWKYASRPPVTHDEYLALRDNCAGGVSFTAFFRSSVSFRGRSFHAGETLGVTPGWEMVVRNPLESGRGFTASELRSDAPVALIGQSVARKLFDGADPVGSTVKVGGVNATVIGVFRQGGANMVSLVDVDACTVVPYGFASRLRSFSGARTSITAHDDASIRPLMRNCRRLRPSEEDNFAINRISFVAEQVGDIFRLVNRLGWIVGIFSLLAGGFGIANIMFVSVVERRPQIGIQKALGATGRTVLMQYLVESATLSVAGGAAGVALTFFLTLLMPEGLVEVRLSAADALAGLAVSALIGVVAGTAPALSASRLSPLEAINA